MKLKGEISEKNIEYFMVNNPRLARFYLLPKIHKRLFDVPGRPVVSHIGYFTERISSFVDSHLQPLAKKVKSYIKDTNDFVNKLKRVPKLPDNAIMCTIDVVGLYPSIPHNEGLAALKRVLEKRGTKKVSTESLVELAEIVLTNNIFEFNEKVFRQLQGTAIGTKMAPPYAILFLAELEEAFLSQCEYKPHIWYRYIDDIFMVWTHGEEKLDEFLNSLNSFHKTIKFTSDWSKSGVNFLDVQVSLKHGTFVTDLYVKPTDTHQFLHPSSCHPYHCKKAIPFSQALRLNRICSDDIEFENRCEDLYDWLIERGYKHKVVEDQIKRACAFDRDDLLTNERPHSKYQVSLNIEYNPVFQTIGKVLKELQCIIQGDSDHRKVFSDAPIVGFSNGKSLKSYLVRAVLPKVEEQKVQKGCFKCGGKRCEVCHNLKETSEFTSHVSKEIFTIEKGPLNCNSELVIYLISCKVCGIQNVGSTKTKFRTRFNNYKSVHRKVREKSFGKTIQNGGRTSRKNNLRTQKDKNEAKYCQEKFHQHFCEAGHKGITDWEVILIDSAYAETTLRRKELFWQYKLDTYFPLGLNEIEAYVDIT